jgi:hypothetical protein
VPNILRTVSQSLVYHSSFEQKMFVLPSLIELQRTNRRFETEESEGTLKQSRSSIAVMAEVDEETRKTIQAYNKLLNSRGTLRASSKAARDPEDALKRLANLILVNGIPAKAVSYLTVLCRIDSSFMNLERISETTNMENTPSGDGVECPKIPGLCGEGTL